MKKIPDVFCDMDICQFNRYYNGRNECTLDLDTRDKYCPHKRYLILNGKDKNGKKKS